MRREDSHVEFRGNVTSTNLNIIGSTTDGATASATFTGGATSSGAIMLNDENNGSTARVTFANNAATTQGAAINAAAAGEGTVLVLDRDGGGAALQTFTGVIGGSGNATRVGLLSIGGADVNGGGNLDAGNAQFDAAVRATTINVIGGADTGEHSSATFTGDVAATIALDDNTGNATATFSGTAAQTLTGNITATRSSGAAGTEAVVVNNPHADGVTFVGNIGTSGVAVDSITVGSTNANSRATLRGNSSRVAQYRWSGCQRWRESGCGECPV